MRCLYTLLLYLIAPLALLRLAWRSIKAPAYRQRWAERFGFIASLPRSDSIWIHAVSVGEVRAALPLIQAFRESYRRAPILVTTMTPTGSQQVLDALGDSVQHVYLPYDLPDAIQRFLQRTQPRIAIVMETELWPNLFHACYHKGIPVVVANARLSQRSARAYSRVRAFIRPALQCIRLIATQTEADSIRFIDLGAPAECVKTTGNIKYDLTLPSGLYQQGRLLRRQLFQQRPVWIAASTHSGEDEQILDAFEQIRKAVPTLVLLLVPRHPERFATVAGLCLERGLRVVQRSKHRTSSARAEVFLGDSMGELLLFYTCADVAFVGGSLIVHGGHNVLEPAALGIPVLFGPHVFNFTQACQHLLDHKAARQVQNSAELAQAVTELLLNKPLRQYQSENAKLAVAKNRGALARLFIQIETILNTTPPSPTFPDQTNNAKKGAST